MRRDMTDNGRTRGQLQRAGADRALGLAQQQRGIGRHGVESHLLDQRRPFAAAHDLEESEAVDCGALERLRQQRVDQRVDRLPFGPARQRRKVDADRPADVAASSAEPRVGKECVSTCRSRWDASPVKKKTKYNTKKS